MKLCILMGSTNISGGSYVIFQHALHAQANGVDVTIVTLESRDLIKTKWHRALSELTFKTYDEIAGETFDLALSTWWKTVYELPRVEARQYAYFVQSIESWFYPESDAAVRNLADATYQMDLPIITQASWIKDYLHKRYDTEAYLVRNGIDKELYHTDGPSTLPRRKKGLRVLVEGPLGVDFKNVARTIRLVRRAKIDEIWLLTISPIDNYPGVDRVFSQVAVEKCPEIYRSCDVLVKLSYVEGMFGPPLEMFHCGGTAIVYDVTGSNEYIVCGKNSLKVEIGDEEAVVQAINFLSSNPKLLARLKSGALETAKHWPGWTISSPLFLDALKIMLNEKPFSQKKLKTLTDKFMHQYLRISNAVRGNFWRLRELSIRIALTALRRYPMSSRYLLPYYAYFIESRRCPKPKTRI